ncbi:MAG: gamma-glutamyltransferase family protein, partial [Actinomycetota bacterium]
DAGGNAADAALAAATTLAVAAPHMCGVGGDLFALVREPSGRTVAVNASGAAPAAVDVDALRREGAMPAHGPHAVTVPGAVSGWWELAERWGRFGLPAALAPAINLARGGVTVSRTLAADLQEVAPRLLADPGATGVFAPAGRPLARGEALVQPALAATLEALAEEGPAALYGGALGDAIARHLRALGSAMSPEDLAAHEAWSGPPLALGYRGLEVHVVPPNSQGFVLLQILALVGRLGLDPDPTGPDAGALAEVFRITAAERDRVNADPRRVDVPVELLLVDEHLAGLAEAVRLRQGTQPPGGRSDTIALVAADASGLGVVLIQSLFDAFGSGILEPTTGVLLHCRGSAFVLEPGHPNVLEGGKRPSHTLLPVVVQREGRLVALAGTMGGGGQPQIDAMTLLRALDLGLGAADAVAAPRWLVGGMALGRTGRRVVAEASVPAAARRSLEDTGYAIDVVADLGRSVGHAHLLLAREDGGFDVGSDPRADGGVGVR